MVKIELPSSGQVDTIIDRDYRNRIDAIVDLVGPEHLSLFLTFKDEPQYGPWKDLLNPRIKFQPYDNNSIAPLVSLGWERVEGGPFGAYIKKVSGPNYPVLQRGFVESMSGTESPTYSPKYATRIAGNADIVGMVSLALRKQGTVSTDAKLRAVIYSDTNGVPGTPINQYDFVQIGERVDPMFLDPRQLSDTDYRGIRFQLLSGMNLHRGSTYWLVLEYADATGVDAENFVQWRYGPVAGGARAYHDGTSWTVVSDEGHDYCLYGDDIDMTNEFTVSVLTYRPTPVTEANLITFNGERETFRIWEIDGTVHCICTDIMGRARPLAKPMPLENWCVLTVTRSRDAVNSLSVYRNGKLVTSSSSEGGGGASQENYPIRRAGLPLGHRAMNISIGKMVRGSGKTYGWAWAGGIGPILVSDRCLSPDEVEKLANLMLYDKPTTEVV